MLRYLTARKAIEQSTNVFEIMVLRFATDCPPGPMKFRYSAWGTPNRNEDFGLGGGWVETLLVGSESSPSSDVIALTIAAPSSTHIAKMDTQSIDLQAGTTPETIPQPDQFQYETS